MRLAHLHLPNPIPYTHSLRLQEAILERHFAYNTAVTASTRIARSQAAISSHKSTLQSSPPPPPPPPPATLLTFSTQPTYTVGRRHLKSNPLSQSQIDFLTTNATSPSSSSFTTDHTIHTDSKNGTTTQEQKEQQQKQLATFYPSPRGGLLTYHAPGQLTAYLILNLRTHAITPRCFIRLWENTIIRTCARLGVRNTLVTDDPGVWISEPSYSSSSPPSPSPSSSSTLQSTHSDTVDQHPGHKSGLNEVEGNDKSCPLASNTSAPSISNSNSKNEENDITRVKMIPTNRKICAIGVHVTRGITSHGVGLNVFDHPIGTPTESGSGALKQLYTLPSRQDGTNSSLAKGSGDDMVEKRAPAATPGAPGYLSWGFSRIVACGLEGKEVTWLTREGSHLTASTNTGGSGGGVMESVADTLAQEVVASLNRLGKVEVQGVDKIEERDVW